MHALSLWVQQLQQRKRRDRWIQPVSQHHSATGKTVGGWVTNHIPQASKMVLRYGSVQLMLWPIRFNRLCFPNADGKTIPVIDLGAHAQTTQRAATLSWRSISSSGKRTRWSTARVVLYMHVLDMKVLLYALKNNIWFQRVEASERWSGGGWFNFTNAFTFRLEVGGASCWWLIINEAEKRSDSYLIWDTYVFINRLT